MKEQDKIWFAKLINDRKDSAKTLEKPSMRGIQDSIVEKYSDQAHFIYELLQNADDAKATKSTFLLTSTGLYFKHNGTISFSISDPETEDKDKENNNLGHINSITSIANSSKTREVSIGKFGVGFKAVFQYTETPYIYDKHFKFKIERFIVPVRLDEDLPSRKTDETAIYFPFNKTEMPKEQAYSDIFQKLKNLVYPTLFLSNLKEVKWEAAEVTGGYTKTITKLNEIKNVTCEKIELFQQNGLSQTQEKLYLFSEYTKDNYKYSIGFFLNNEGQLTAKRLPAFCYFPTKEMTGLNFILHAPFLLTDSREGIHRSKDHNTTMVELLAKLAADSLLSLKKLELINDNIFEVIPYKKKEYGHDDFFHDFYQRIRMTLKTNEILPSTNNVFAHKRHAYWAESPDLTVLFSNQQLADLVKHPKAKWVFTSIGRSKDIGITNYIDGGSERQWERKDPNLIKSSLDFENKIANLITRDFIKDQPNEWLHKLYEYLSERKSYQENTKRNLSSKTAKATQLQHLSKTGKIFITFYLSH